MNIQGSLQREAEAHQACASDQSNRVYVIDDDLQLRRSLHFVLSTAGFISWPFSCASDFLENLAALEPAPILCDLRMPTIDGIELLAILAEREIRWPIIVMTAHADIPAAVQSIKLGATEFLEKPFDFEALETALHAAMERLSVITNAAESRRRSHQLFDTLSAREIEVLTALINGQANKAAAYQLTLSVRTIEMHRANALLKLKVKSIAEVMRLAHDAGITFTPRGSMTLTE